MEAENISMANVQCKATFKGTMPSLLSYTRAFEEDCSVLVVYKRVIDVVDIMNSSSFLAANFRATYICYIRNAKMVIKYQGLLYLLVNLPRTHQRRVI